MSKQPNFPLRLYASHATEIVYQLKRLIRPNGKYKELAASFNLDPCDWDYEGTNNDNERVVNILCSRGITVEAVLEKMSNLSKFEGIHAEIKKLYIKINPDYDKKERHLILTNTQESQSAPVQQFQEVD
jgi:hypothetical protein